MSKKEQPFQLSKPLSYKRNCKVWLKPDDIAVFLHTPPVPELWDEKELYLARLDGYAIIPLEAYKDLNISEQVWAFYNKVGDG